MTVNSVRKHPVKGLVGVMPSPLQAPLARFAYWVRIGGISPFGLGLNLSGGGLPQDLWKGDPHQGKRILNKRFTFAGCDISFSKTLGWYSREGSVDWSRALHGFRWLRDVASYNDTRLASQYVREYIADWLMRGGLTHPVACEPDVRGERIASWLIYARYILRGAPSVFARRFHYELVKQALQLRQDIREGNQTYGLIAVKGLIFAALTIPQCSFLLKDAMRALHVVLQYRVLPEGAGFSRSPQRMFQNLRTLIEIRHALGSMGGIEDQRVVAIEGQLLEWVNRLLHADYGFALFNGATEGDGHTIKAVLSKARGKLAHAPQEVDAVLLERLQYARMQAGDTLLLIDAAAPNPAAPDNYYGTLSMEFSHGFQRLVVNCGAYFGNDAAWGRVVKTTAAHSALCVDDRNSCQFHHLVEEGQTSAGNISSQGRPHVERRTAQRDGYQFFEGVYNGYVPYTGIRHSRQLLLNQEGTRLTGADQLLPEKDQPPARPHDVNLRFHLHPSVKARRLMNGVVVLEGEDGIEWSFHASIGQAVALDETIYLGIHGRPTSSTQIVLYAPYNPGEEWNVEWSFIRSDSVR